jgi:phosphoenolpyruvate carboxylase
VLVRSGPDSARRGRLRITEQGELINEKYGLRPIALRVFEQAFNALTLSRAGVIPPEHVDPQWRAAMDLLGDEASRVYRATVYEDGEFADFFRQVAPIDVIERMQIGSRPTSRTESSGIEALRSIPWMHAWSQCRYMLPGWYGAGSALALAREQLGEPLLREMCNSWFFFSNLIDDIELALGSRRPRHCGCLREPGRREVPAIRRRATRRVRATPRGGAQGARRRALTGRRADGGALDYVA